MPSPEIRARPIAVAAVSVAFIGAGLAQTSTVSRMPEIKAQVGASATELAFALVCIGIGSLIAMPFAGRLTARFGTAAIVRLFTTIGLVGWGLIPLAGSVPELAAILLLTGIGVGTWDVAMNVQGSIVERNRTQVLMPLWHGLFSVGSVAGALAGAAAAKWGVPLGWQIPLVSLVLWIAVQVGCFAFLDNPAPPDPVAEGTPGHDGVPDRRPRRRGPTGLEILLGLILLSTAIGEGAANDWLAVALVDERDVLPSIGALALAGFNVTMAIGRFSGGPLIARFGRTRCLRVAGAVATAGVLLLCLVPSTTVALIGSAAWGLGLAIVFPSAISAAGEIPGRSGDAIAIVSTIGYAGFLFGAPTIGTLAHVIPLLDALLLIAGFGILIVVLAPSARERRAATRTIAGS